MKDELQKVSKNENKYCKIIKFYKTKLVNLGVMKQLPSKCTTLDEGIYVKDLILEKKSKKRARVKNK